MIAPLFSQERLVMARQRKILSLKMNYGPGPREYILNSFKYENVERSTKQQRSKHNVRLDTVLHAAVLPVVCQVTSCD